MARPCPHLIGNIVYLLVSPLIKYAKQREQIGNGNGIRKSERKELLEDNKTVESGDI